VSKYTVFLSIRLFDLSFFFSRLLYVDFGLRKRIHIYVPLEERNTDFWVKIHHWFKKGLHIWNLSQNWEKTAPKTKKAETSARVAAVCSKFFGNGCCRCSAWWTPHVVLLWTYFLFPNMSAFLLCDMFIPDWSKMWQILKEKKCRQITRQTRFDGGGGLGTRWNTEASYIFAASELRVSDLGVRFGFRWFWPQLGYSR